MMSAGGSARNLSLTEDHVKHQNDDKFDRKIDQALCQSILLKLNEVF